MTSRPQQPAASASSGSGRISLSTPSGIAAAIPHLLGFRPRCSLVLVLLDPAASCVRLTLRADLAGPRDIDPESGRLVTPERWARALAARTAFAGSRQAILVVYPDGPPEPGQPLPSAEAVRAVRTALAERGIASLRELCLWGERSWDYPADHGGGPAGEGQPLDRRAALAVSSALVLAGKGFAEGREVLERSLEPLPGPVQGRIGAVLAEQEARVARLISGQDVQSAAAPGGALLERLPDGRQRPFVPRQVDVAAYERWRDDALSGLAAAVAAADPRGRPPSDEVVATVVFALHDVRVRDTWLWDLVRGEAAGDREAAVGLLAHCVRRAPEDWIAPAATCAAVAWWTLGNGAMALVALDRALACDPGYSLALLVLQALDHGLPPDTYREAMAGLSREECRTGTRPPHSDPRGRAAVSLSETGPSMLDAAREVG